MNQIKSMNINKLLLDVDNPRFPTSAENQRDAIAKMLELQYERIYRLAKDIVAKGLDPSENILVYPSEEEDGFFIVAEGNRQDGKWRMDVRFNRDDLISRIENIANYNQRIVVTNLDALEFLEALNFLDSVDKADKNKTLLYLDPPYYIKGQGLYRNFYEHDDHVLVMEKLRDINFPKWLVSYDNAKEIKDIYSDFPQVEYSLQYTAQQKKSGEEVMIFSPEVVIPDTLKGVSMKISA